jgi:hypothetical protein
VRHALDVADAQEQVDQRSAGLLDGGGDRRERRMTEVRAEDVVVPDHAYLTWDLDPEVLQPLQHADGEQALGGDAIGDGSHLRRRETARRRRCSGRRWPRLVRSSSLFGGRAELADEFLDQGGNRTGRALFIVGHA